MVQIPDMIMSAERIQTSIRDYGDEWYENKKTRYHKCHGGNCYSDYCVGDHAALT